METSPFCAGELRGHMGMAKNNGKVADNEIL